MTHKTSLLDTIYAHFAALNALCGETEGNISRGSAAKYFDICCRLREDFAALARPLRVLEIGFNAGHSSALFGVLFSGAEIVSVDIGAHKYVSAAYEYVQKNTFAQRTLLLGDSRQVVPTLSGAFDLIFIDGGHDGDIPWADLRNCCRLAGPNTVLFMDEICSKQSYGVAPTAAWDLGVAAGAIVEQGRWLSDDETLGFAWGKYTEHARDYFDNTTNRATAPSDCSAVNLTKMPVYVLNLDKRPERLTQTKTELRRVGFTDIRRVQGFDGSTWRVVEPPEKIGGFMTHWAAWWQVATGAEDIALIVEDDVVFHPNFARELPRVFAELPHEWQLCNLHSTMARCNKLGEYLVELTSHGWGAHAYLLKKSGAIKCLQQPVNGAVDHVLMHDCRALGIIPYGINDDKALAFQRGESSDIPQSAQLLFWKTQKEKHCQQLTKTMKIAVYALAKNEEQHAAAWAESCKDADYRVVTDTGSTDKTPDILRAAGVTVHTGNVMPWRWDEAHNLSLHHVPSDADVCVRLDLDERFKPGWRKAIEKAWKPDTTKLRYMYTWSMAADGTPLKKFPSDRVHARSGYRWTGATHEGLVKWNGKEVYAWSDDLEILHHRDVGKKHSTDLELLQVAVRETPHDARMHWYLARQMDYENHAETVATFTKYLDLAGGSASERGYACRVLARRIPDKADYWLQRSIQEDSSAPEGYYQLAKRAHQNKEHLAAFYWAQQAVERSKNSMMHTSDSEAFGHLPADLAGVNAFLLGLHKDSLRYTKIALERNPGDERLTRNIGQLEAQLATH